MRRPPARGLLLELALLAVLIATLWPLPGEQSEQWIGCIVCGNDGVADVLRNVILFVPFGAALALNDWDLAPSALAGGLLSACVECAQFYIPGRDASLGDVASNTLGATLGAVVIRTAPAWLSPVSTRAVRLSRAAALAAVAVCCVTGALSVPSLPSSLYYGMWTPNLGHLEWYRGRVVDATIAGLHVTPGPIADSRLVRALLAPANGMSLHVRAVAGPRTVALGPRFAIYDDRQREIALLGPDRGDLVFRVRTRAAALHLDQADIRLVEGMLGGTIGDTLDITVAGGSSGGRGYRMVLNSRSESGLGPSVGSGWALLMYSEALPAWCKTLLGAVWLGVVFLPTGFWMRTRRDVLFASGALAVGLAAVPALTSLVATSLLQWVAAMIGVLAGAGLHAVSSGSLSGAARWRRGATAWTSWRTQRSIRE